MDHVLRRKDSTSICCSRRRKALHKTNVKVRVLEVIFAVTLILTGTFIMVTSS